MHDFVWFTSEHSARALELVKRVDAAACMERRANPVRFWLDAAPIPNLEGVAVSDGTCVCPNVLGSDSFAPARVQQTSKGRVLTLADALALRELEPGLVVGDFRDRDGFMSTPEMKQAAKNQAAAEANDREATMQRNIERAMLAAVLAAGEIKALSTPEPWYRRWFSRSKPLLDRINERAGLAMQAIEALANPLPPHVIPADPLGNARAAYAAFVKRKEK